MRGVCGQLILLILYGFRARGGKGMLIEYIDKAMGKAVHDKLDDGGFSGKIRKCPGVIASGETLHQLGAKE
jgi:hypothetical protein